jgi:3'-phosphoadenosine 5'-phosphosulfate sulfotransferase (PAPS reductase)/FAD synthetase
MEYPQVRRFAKEKDGIIRLRPEGTIKQIIDDCGWNFPSKDVAAIIEAARRDKKWAIDRLNGLGKDGKPSAYREMYKKWWPLVDAPFKISDRCCLRMKEDVVAKYEKETGRHPILALMADESARRQEAYLRTGCNAFEKSYFLDPETGEEVEQVNKRPMSKPMGFWTENDVLQYLYENKISIAEPYGQIVEENQVAGQMNLFDMGVSSSCQGCKYRTTGESRTGCMFCTVGCHLDHFAKIKRLKAYSPKLYDYCMDYLGEREVLSWIDRHYCQK